MSTSEIAAVPTSLSHDSFSLEEKIHRRKASVGVIGLGYGGLPLAVTFARAGFDVTGCFNADEAFSRLPDPWSDQYVFGGNGDGTLFYPCRPDRIGGKTDIPIETIRLKPIREGLEDYEYSMLLFKTRPAGFVDQVVSRIAGTTCDWKRDPGALYAARQKQGETLDTQINQSKVNASQAGEAKWIYTLPRVSSSCLASE